MLVANSDGTAFATSPPNPSCCSNGSVMCPRCAAMALGIQGHGADLGPPGFTANEKRPEPLVPLVINWDEESEERKVKDKQQPTTNDGRPSPLIPIVLEW